MFRLPFTFIVTGMVSFILFHLLSILDFSGWLMTEPRSPEGWFRIHLLVLGWATMIAMGAVYQLINVVLQTKLHSERLGFIHYGCFAVGTTGLLIGFKTMQTPWIAGFSTLAVVGILLFTWNLGRTLWKAQQWTAITLSTAAAVVYLSLNGISGMLMGLNFEFQWLTGSWQDQLLGAHIWLGAVGWFGLLITGFSYKMLPMFFLAHDYPEKLQRVIFWVWNAAVWAGVAGFMSGIHTVKVLALVLLTTALVIYNLHIQQIWKARHKPQPGAGITWSLWSVRLLTVISAIASVVYSLAPSTYASTSWVVFLVWAYLYGWVAVTILGYLSKIIPFLWWTHKYGPHVGKKAIPTMGQLLKEKPVHIGLGLVIGTLVALLVGMGLQMDPMIQAAGSALALCAIGYMLLIARAFTR